MFTTSDPQVEPQHGTRPVGARMGQKTGTCPTCAQPVHLDRGIWRHDDAATEAKSFART